MAVEHSAWIYQWQILPNLTAFQAACVEDRMQVWDTFDTVSGSVFNRQELDCRSR